MGNSALIGPLKALKRQLTPLIRPLKYRFALLFQPRQNRIYTQFYRFPNQYKALVEKVIPYLSLPKEPKCLEIVVFACCSGDEVYTLAYILKENFPSLAFRIRAFDIVEEVITKARAATYTKDDVYAGPFVTEAFTAGAFNIEDGSYKVKPELTSLVSLELGNMLDAAFMESLGKCDIVLAQNVLFHLEAPLAKAAFKNLNSLLKPKAALFINGMDMGMRVKSTKQCNLEPLNYLIEEIHNDARVDRGENWANQYWGREPFSNKSNEWMRKYGTIYYKKH